MSELEYCAFCDGGYAHSGICDKCTAEIGQTGKELADKEKQLAEARAEIERLNKSFGDSLDTIFAMLLAARGAECDIDTLKAEMKPVSSKPSEYIKHTIAERDKLIVQMREALQEVMVLCDAVPTRAHDMAKDYHLREIGRIVNVKGLYHVVKAALCAAERLEE